MTNGLELTASIKFGLAYKEKNKYQEYCKKNNTTMAKELRNHIKEVIQ